MRKLLFILALVSASLSGANAQMQSFGQFPVDIVSDQETRFVGGVAIAEQNVIIRYRDTTIHADYAEYNDDTRDVLVRGNVRIYREGHTFVGDRAVYNLETKQLRAANFRGDFYPFAFKAESLTSRGANHYLLTEANLTTSDSSRPDYYVRAKSVRIYPNDRVVFNNVTLYLGKTPVLWWPFLYQSLDQTSSFTIAPGYRSNWGTYLLYSQGFPVSETTEGRLRLDLRSSRGAAAGLDLEYRSKKNSSWAEFRSYFIDDSDPGKYKQPNAQLHLDPTKDKHGKQPITPDNLSSVTRKVPSSRYRASMQSRYFLTDEIYATININKLSDPVFLKDFYPGEYRLDPQPDNVIALTKLEDDYTLTGIARMQLNDFFETTERLPELVFDMKRTALFSSPVYYEGSTGVARFQRRFPEGTVAPVGYSATRFDSFHQFVLPKTIGGWLSVVPRVGVRGTYYGDTSEEDVYTMAFLEHPLGLPMTTGTDLNSKRLTARRHIYGKDYQDTFRGVFNAGFESSFKFCREFNDVQSRPLGLDGLRHIVQPYTDLSFVRTSRSPEEILQFDRFLPSDQLPSFSFPQFTGLDSISNWTVWRMGVRNRLQTRRDDQTINWLSLDSYFNINIQEPTLPGIPARQGGISNFYNRLVFQPVPWMSYRVDTQIPLNNKGFTEANTSANFFVSKDLQLNVGHRFLSGNPFFSDSNLMTLGGYYRINENWGFSFTEQYEVKDSTLEWQRYEIHRDLSSWIVSVGFTMQDNSPNKNEYAVLLTFTLKAFPNINLQLSEDPNSRSSAD